MKILLVDDDDFLRDMYATKFTEHGDTVVGAATGQDALQHLSTDVFDVIIMDMVMPGMSGTQLLGAIRGIESAKDTKCIVLSNQGEEEDIEAMKDAGAVGYIIKKIVASGVA